MKQVDQFISDIMTSRKKQFCLFFIILVLFSLLTAYRDEPIYRGVDFHFHFRRFISLINALRDGTFPTYIDYNAINGYGYLSNTFYPDFILIPFAFIGLISSPLFGYKFAIFTSSILCGFFTYRAVDKIFKNSLAASLAGILYTFCNYRLYDYFHRSSLGELFTFAFVPIVILGLYYIIEGDYKRKWYVIAIGFSLIIFSHVISSLLMAITVIVILVICCKKLVKEPKRILYLALAGLATIILTSYSLFPMLEQMQSDTFNYNVSNWYPVDKYQLSIYWIICGMTTGPTYENLFDPPKIGLLLTLGICLCIFVQKKKSKELKLANIAVIVGFVLLLMISELFPWTIFPFSKLSFIQFPWRLFQFISFFFAIAGAYYLSQISLSDKRIFALFLGFVIYAGFVIVSESKIYKETVDLPAFAYLDTAEPSIKNNYLGTGKEYLPESVSIETLYEKGDIITSRGNNSVISNINRNGGILNFDISTNGSDNIELPLIYYKGYEVRIDGTELPVNKSNNGLVTVSVGQSGRVEAYYAGTVVQKVSFYITIAGILLLCIYIYLAKRRRKNMKIAIG